jgi:hypothetical protein
MKLRSVNLLTLVSLMICVAVLLSACGGGRMG